MQNYKVEREAKKAESTKEAMGRSGLECHRRRRRRRRRRKKRRRRSKTPVINFHFIHSRNILIDKLYFNSIHPHL